MDIQFLPNSLAPGRRGNLFAFVAVATLLASGGQGAIAYAAAAQQSEGDERELRIVGVPAIVEIAGTEGVGLLAQVEGGVAFMTTSGQHHVCSWQSALVDGQRVWFQRGVAHMTEGGLLGALASYRHGGADWGRRSIAILSPRTAIRCQTEFVEGMSLDDVRVTGDGIAMAFSSPKESLFCAIPAAALGRVAELYRRFEANSELSLFDLLASDCGGSIIRFPSAIDGGHVTCIVDAGVAIVSRIASSPEGPVEIQVDWRDLEAPLVPVAVDYFEADLSWKDVDEMLASAAVVPSAEQERSRIAAVSFPRARHRSGAAILIQAGDVPGEAVGVHLEKADRVTRTGGKPQSSVAPRRFGAQVALSASARANPPYRVFVVQSGLLGQSSLYAFDLSGRVEWRLDAPAEFDETLGVAVRNAGLLALRAEYIPGDRSQGRQHLMNYFMSRVAYDGIEAEQRVWSAHE